MDELTKIKGQLDQTRSKLNEVGKRINALLTLDELNDEQRKEYESLEAEQSALAQKETRLEKAEANELARLDRETKKEKAEQVLRLTEEKRSRELDPKPGDRRKADADQPRHTTTDKETGRTVSSGQFEETDESVRLLFGESKDAQQRLSYHKQKLRNFQHLKSCGYGPWGEFKSLREFVREGLESHTHSSFRDRHQRHFAAVQGMSEGTGSDGGYTVMPEFASGIIDRMYTNTLWAMTDNYPVSGNSMTFLANAETSRATGSRHGGLRGYWLSEGASITSSKPTMREVTLKLMKLGVVVYLTQELIDDSGFALEEYVAKKAAEEFTFMIGDSLFNGTGVGQPTGILSAPSLVSVAKESGQLAATLETENIEKMYARFYMPNISRMNWFHNQDILPELNTMTLGVGTGGVPTYLPPGGLSVAPYGTLKGRPLTPTEFNATLGTQGDIVAADMGQMLSISKGGVAQAVSMHIQFLTDQLALRFVMRLNAGPWESAPVTPYKGTANTQSSFVTLDTRA